MENSKRKKHKSGKDDLLENKKRRGGSDRKPGEVPEGTNNDDVIVGGRKADKVKGGLGDDRIRGGHKNDALAGDEGNDILMGDAGNDVLEGGLGNDSLFGGQGKDTLSGGEGDDVLDGGQGKDTLNGGLGNDKLMGGQGNDMLIGSVAQVMPSDLTTTGTSTDPTTGTPTPVAEVDILMGGQGKDTFVLGLAASGTSPASVFYSAAGDLDYAVIADLKMPDKIQLAGAATDYVLGATSVTVAGKAIAGTGIYKVGATNELIAVMAGVNPTTMTMASPAFTFV